jgi:uncharacterized protein (DUF2236 family)
VTLQAFGFGGSGHVNQVSMQGRAPMISAAWLDHAAALKHHPWSRGRCAGHTLDAIIPPSSACVLLGRV